MIEYFRHGYSGAPFVLFGTAHILTVVGLALFGLVFVLLARRADEAGRRRYRRTLASILAINETAWHVWSLSSGTWTVQEGLPLHLCSVMILLTIPVLWLNYRALFPLVYFLGIAGAIQAVITPDAGIYGFPHFRFFQTLIAHGGLVIAGLYVALAESYKPQKRSIVHILVGLNIYALLIWIVNSAIGSNYLYVNGKPAVPTLIDVMPAWPWYIGILEVLAFLLMVLLWLPFAGRASGPSTIQAE